MSKYYITPRNISLIFLLLYLVPLTLCGQEQSCTSREDHPYLYFGTRTGYDVARNPQGPPEVPGCKPLHIWMVARHGAHWTLPIEKSNFVNLMNLRDQVAHNHELGRGTLCAEDLEKLKDWREFLVSSDEEESLTPQGRRDSYALGARLRQALPALFENRNASTDFEFRHTEMDITKETAGYFAKGLFGNDYDPDFRHPLRSNRLLEGFENCPAWTNKNEKIQEKVDQFVKGKLMHEVNRNVSQRLGFNYDLPFYVVEAMYQWCAYEQSLSLDTPAPWCAAFASPELKVMEFLDDLRYFYTTGPGDRTGINKRLGCPLARDMLTRFTAVEKDPNMQRTKGVFYFGEAEAVGLAATRLGLFADRHPLFSTTYVSQGERTFRTSALLPWGANLMAVFYRCSSGEKYRVMFLVAEHVVATPWCPSGLCPWSLIKHRLGRMVLRTACSDDFCFHLPHSWIPLSTVELWAIIAFVSTILFVFHLIRAVNRLTA